MVAYRPADNLLYVVECKSYLDSRGVHLAGLLKKGGRYKLFSEATTRRIVFNRLVKQLSAAKSIRPAPEVQLCLAAGKMVRSDEQKIRQHFEKKGWLLLDRDWICTHLQSMADDGYDNAVATVTAKLLLRKQSSRRARE